MVKLKIKTKKRRGFTGWEMGVIRVMRVMAVMGIMGWKTKTNSKTSPAQLDSGISIFGVGVLGILRILGWQTKNKTSHAQRDSGISVLRIPISPIGPIGLIKTTKSHKPLK